MSAFRKRLAKFVKEYKYPSLIFAPSENVMCNYVIHLTYPRYIARMTFNANALKIISPIEPYDFVPVSIKGMGRNLSFFAQWQINEDKYASWLFDAFINLDDSPFNTYELTLDLENVVKLWSVKTAQNNRQER